MGLDRRFFLSGGVVWFSGETEVGGRQQRINGGGGGRGKEGGNKNITAPHVKIR